MGRLVRQASDIREDDINDGLDITSRVLGFDLFDIVPILRAWMSGYTCNKIDSVFNGGIVDIVNSARSLVILKDSLQSMEQQWVFVVKLDM